MEGDVEGIRQGVAQLVEQEKRNSNKIQESLDLYDNLRSDIADNADLYGTVITELEKHLANIETEFSPFLCIQANPFPEFWRIPPDISFLVYSSKQRDSGENS